MSGNEELVTATPEESRTISDAPAHTEPTPASVDVTQHAVDPPASDLVVLEEQPTASPPPPPSAPPAPPANADVRITDTAAKPHRTEPTLEDCISRLDLHITESKPELGKKLFQNDIRKYGDMAKTMISSLQDLGCELRLAKEFSVLALYDLVIFIDDSTSMGSGVNKETLKKTLTEICDIYKLANKNGIKAVRYVNNVRGKKNVVTAQDLEEVVKRCARVGVSRIGTELYKRIILDFVLKPKPAMVKPLLVIIIANGTPVGESENVLQDAVSECFKTLDQTQRSQEYVAFEFCRIGDGPDTDSIELFRELDKHKEFGFNVDHLPEAFHLEDIGNPKEKAGNKWNMMGKLLLGAILPHWDKDDNPIINKEDLQHLENNEEFIDD